MSPIAKHCMICQLFRPKEGVMVADDGCHLVDIAPKVIVSMLEVIVLAEEG